MKVVEQMVELRAALVGARGGGLGEQDRWLRRRLHAHSGGAGEQGAARGAAKGRSTGPPGPQVHLDLPLVQLYS